MSRVVSDAIVVIELGRWFARSSSFGAIDE